MCLCRKLISAHFTAVASKPKKPESTGSKDSDSRASTPSKDVPVSVASSGATVSSTSRGRSSKPPSTPLPITVQSTAPTTPTTTAVTTVAVVKDEAVLKDDGPK